MIKKQPTTQQEVLARDIFRKFRGLLTIEQAWNQAKESLKTIKNFYHIKNKHYDNNINNEAPRYTEGADKSF